MLYAFAIFANDSFFAVS